MRIFKLETYKEYSIFFWIIFVSILGIGATLFYTQNKIDQSTQIKSSLENIYFQKTIKEITNNLNPRFTKKSYISKSGDTYQTIINKLDLSKEEKAVLLSTIADEKSLKILKINQKFIFKFDNLSEQKIVEFVIQTDKKNEFYLENLKQKINFYQRKLKKILKKN